MEEQFDVLTFIKKRFPIDCFFCNGNCYYFALILKERFGGEIYYDVIEGHFVTKIKGIFYDWTGLYITQHKLVSWEKFNEYDSFLKERIEKECIKNLTF